MLGMFANRRSGLQNAMDGNPLAGAMSFNSGSLAPAASGPQQMPGMTAPLQQQAPVPAGMFAGGGRRRGVDWGQLGAMILAANGNQLGTFGLQQRAFQQQQEERARQQQEQEQRQRDEWLFRQNWQRENPAPQAPSEIMRLAQEAGYQPGTPEWQEAMRTAFLNRQNPMVGIDIQQPDGSTIRQFIRPPAGGGQQGGDDEWEYGGPSQPATGNFPG